jgi:tRNA-splicing ligase RtcB (3'-phosphate/5'-hydroxy nucleic acid ligase)
MDVSSLHKLSDQEWQIDPTGDMRVPAIIYGDVGLVGEMDDRCASRSSMWRVCQGSSAPPM